jgi:hypothetical protein
MISVLPKIPERFSIYAFSEGEQISFVPIKHSPNIIIHFVPPLYTCGIKSTVAIGNKILEIATYIEDIDSGVVSVEELDDKAVLKLLGHSSWARVKKNMRFVQISRIKIEEEDENTVRLIPMHSAGRGYQYLFSEPADIKRSNLENPKEIGQAFLNALAVFE